MKNLFVIFIISLSILILSLSVNKRKFKFRFGPKVRNNVLTEQSQFFDEEFNPLNPVEKDQNGNPIQYVTHNQGDVKELITSKTTDRKRTLIDRLSSDESQRLNPNQDLLAVTSKLQLPIDHEAEINAPIVPEKKRKISLQTAVQKISKTAKRDNKHDAFQLVGIIKSYSEIDEYDIDKWVSPNERQEIDLIFSNPTTNQNQKINSLAERLNSLLPTLKMFKSRFQEACATSEAKKVIFREAQEKLEHVIIYLITDLSLNYYKTTYALEKIFKLCERSSFLSLMSFIHYIDNKIEENTSMLKQVQSDENGGSTVDKVADDVIATKYWLKHHRFLDKFI